LLNDISILDGHLGNHSRPDSSATRQLAPFYPLPPALGKRVGMALLQEGRQIPGHFVAQATVRTG
jgi:hypothetical protein